MRKRPKIINSLPNDKISDPLQIKSVLTQRNHCNLKIEILLGMDRKHCVKRRKCWLPAFSPFPAIFSRGFFFRVVKSRDCVVKS